MRKFLVLIFALFFVVSANASEVCAVNEKDVSDARSVLKHSSEYIEQLNNISFLSFKGINTSAETAASLMEEKEKLKVNFSLIFNSATAIVHGSSECAARDWNIILFNTATSIRMMEDLEKFNLIKDCKVCWFSVMVLSQSHENLAIKLKNL